MSTCTKDLFDFDLIKKCRVCKFFSFKSNFRKNTKSEGGLQSEAKVFKNDHNKNYFKKSRDSELERCRKYKFLNREKSNKYVKNRMRTDLNYELAHKIRVRTCPAFKSPIVKKLNKTFD